VYVYGVLRSADLDALSVTGVAGSPVRAVERDELAALVSDLEGGALAAAREVRAHWRVLEEASGSATVLPVRFGTVMESEDGVRDRLLAPNAERLTGLLGELAGRVQLSVKGDYDEQRLLRKVVRGAPAIGAMQRRLRTLPEEAGYYDRIRLGEAVAAEVGRQREEDTGLALDRLAPLAVASRAEALGSPDAAFNLAFLVESNRVDDFSAGVRALAGEFGERLHIRYVGPLPPYSFAEMDLAAGSASWA
jgi:hypothetical protein